MKAVLLDFNGTLFFDTCFHLEAWSEIYRELHRGGSLEPDPSAICGPCNDAIIQAMAPELSPEERTQWSIRKEALYRNICSQHPDQLQLTRGAQELFFGLKERKIPFTLATASIIDNFEFYFQTFPLEPWFQKELCVYDDGTYADKGEMHKEAARRLGTTLSDCIVVEDSVTAISLARKNGAKEIIGVGSDSIHPELIRSGATHCIRDFTEFDYGWLRN